MNVNILIVDNQPVLVKGLRDALATQPGLNLLGEAATGAEALRLAAVWRPDVIIVGLPNDGMTPEDLTRRFTETAPQSRVVIYGGEEGRRPLELALQAGAAGYLRKTASLEQIIAAIRSVMEGRLYISPEMAGSVLEEYRQTLLHGHRVSPPPHTERERQLLRLVAAGRRNKEIAGELEVTTKSVETYRSRLMKRLQCSSTAELVRYAIREGIAPL